MKIEAKRLLKGLLTRRTKIVCLGLSKTGTTTFASCMTTLGFKHKSQGPGFWYEERRLIGARYILSRYDSVDDLPWPFIYKEIDRWFPGSQFILTTRCSADEWYSSLCKHYARSGPTENSRIFYNHYSPFDNREHHIRVYRDHNNAVRRYFAGRPNFTELCWEKGAGWTELCGFLGLPTPPVEFPHVNKSDESFDYAGGKARADALKQSILEKRRRPHSSR